MRLKNWIERTGAVSERQYGFCEGRDTVMAIRKIMGYIQTKQKKEHSMVVLLDLSNAFNMAWPPHVYDELREAKVPLYLRKVVASFMTDRKIQSGRICMNMKRGYPQGSSEHGSNAADIVDAELVQSFGRRNREGEESGIRRRPVYCC